MCRPFGDRRSIRRRRSAPATPHFPAEGQAGAADLLLRGVQPPRHLGLQARADQAARPADAGAREAVTFQGENGNLAKSPWQFRPRGESGKMTSRPAAAPGRAGRRHVLHPLDDLEDEHARARRDVHEHRVHARGLPERRGVGQLCARDREPGPARLTWRSPTRAASRSQGRRTGPTASCRPSSRGPPSTPTADPAPGPPAGDLEPADRADARLPQAAQRRAPRRATPATPSSRARIASYELAARMQLSAPEVGDLRARVGGHARALRPRRRQPDPRRLRPQLPAGAAAAGARRAVRAALQRRLRDGRGRRQLGRPPGAQGRLRPPRPDPRPARRRPAAST